MDMNVMHHSRLAQYRRPFGACHVDQEVGLHIVVAGKNPEAWVLLYGPDGRQSEIPMQTLRREGETFILGTSFVVEQSGLYYYCFRLLCEGKEYYLGCEAGKTGGIGKLYEHSGPPCFQITVYWPWGQSPLRSKNIYQIMVDRFRRGDKENCLAGLAYHRSMGRRMILHEDWNESPNYLPLPGDIHYDPCDCFGGDLRGVINKLDYIQSLGTDIIYFNPIFEAPSNHKYNTADFLKIDPMLGGEADFRELCEKALDRGMRVMLDGVFSHTGADSVYFNKTRAYGMGGACQSMESPYYSWYTFYDYPHTYRGWWGFETLPETNEMDKDFMEFIMFGKESVVGRWASFGASLWRLDVADELPDAFIRTLRRNLKRLAPKGALLGEVWEDASNKFSHGEKRQYCMGEELDSVMNYPMRNTLIAFLRGEQDAFALKEEIMSLFENYPREFFYSCMNLTSSHDVPRALSELCGAPHRNTLSREQQAEVVFSEEGLGFGKTLLRQLFAMLYVLPGSPSMYYGDEAGMQGMADPFNRGTYPWGAEDRELLEYVRTLGNVRRLPVLRQGRFVLHAVNKDCVAVVRYIYGGYDAFGTPSQDALAILLVNRCGYGQRMVVDLRQVFEGADGQGLLTLETFVAEGLLGDDGITVDSALLDMEVEAYGMRLYYGELPALRKTSYV
ncbi:MAG: glycoside hydrolase family 13 protein [Christensenellales bacterium]